MGDMMSAIHESLFDAANGVYRDPKLSFDVANAVLETLTAHDIVPVYRHQLEAFAAECVHHGDMTPAAQIKLSQILEGR